MRRRGSPKVREHGADGVVYYRYAALQHITQGSGDTAGKIVPVARRRMPKNHPFVVSPFTDFYNLPAGYSCGGHGYF